MATTTHVRFQPIAPVQWALINAEAGTNEVFRAALKVAAFVQPYLQAVVNLVIQGLNKAIDLANRVHARAYTTQTTPAISTSQARHPEAAAEPSHFEFEEEDLPDLFALNAQGAPQGQLNQVEQAVQSESAPETTEAQRATVRLVVQVTEEGKHPGEAAVDIGTLPPQVTLPNDEFKTLLKTLPDSVRTLVVASQPAVEAVDEDELPPLELETPRAAERAPEEAVVVDASTSSEESSEVDESEEEEEPEKATVGDLLDAAVRPASSGPVDEAEQDTRSFLQQWFFPIDPKN